MDKEGAPQPDALDEQQECFVTLFDQAYLTYGLVLARSLRRHLPTARLFIIAMGDPGLVATLIKLGFPADDIIPISEVEARHPALAKVKPTRHAGEYCWTVTSFAVEQVFARCPQVMRATYLDADLWFNASPRALFAELERAGKQVLITEHAFTPAYAHNERLGRFCVQFVPFTRDPGALTVMHSWQEQCVDWCFDRYDGERFGDQKYLDHWPERFPDIVHISTQPELTQAPWNRARFADHQPVFYHCHSLRQVACDRIILHRGYHLTARQAAIYDGVVADHAWAVATLNEVGIPLVCRPGKAFRRLLVEPVFSLLNRARFVTLPAVATVPATSGITMNGHLKAANQGKESAAATTNQLSLMGYQLIAGSCSALAEAVLERIVDQCAPVTRFACLNPHSFVEARSIPEFAAALRGSDVLVADGSGVALAARVLGQRGIERIPGPDFFVALSAACASRGEISCFFLGSTPQVLALIVDRMAREFPGMRVAGTFSPPFAPGHVFAPAVEDELVAAVNAARPDLLWLGLTAPKQELFMQRNATRLNVRFIGCIGAAFDFFAGTKARSHPFFRALGLEWLPRLMREPRRLARRNFVSSPLFLFFLLVTWCRKKAKKQS